jgi:hypothetical protein
MVLCLAIIAAGLWFIVEPLYGHLLADLVTAHVDAWFGLPVGRLTAMLAPYLIPGAVAVFLVYAAYRVAYWGLERTVFADDPHASALQLPSMNVTEIAEYLRDQSVWGRRTYAHLNDNQFVQDAVPAEMKRAALSGEMRFIGTPPNKGTSEEIDPTYWRFASFEGDRIWDSRNNFFTTVLSPSPSVPNLFSYQFGKAPYVDVIHTWPCASLTRKTRALLWVVLKKRWWSIKARIVRCLLG